MKKILISASNGPIMKEMINLLKKKFYVIGIDSFKIGQADKYCNKFYECPPGSSKAFIKFLEQISKKVDFIFLFVDE